MTDPFTQRFERLPKWAQELITTLRNQNGELRAHVEALNEEHGDSGVYVQNFTHGDRALPAGTVVRFHGPADWRTARGYITVRVLPDGEVEVSGNQALTVRPHVSNVIRVRVGRPS